MVDEALVTSLGLTPDAVTKLMRDVGFRAQGDERAWVWRGRGRRRERTVGPVSPAFAALAGLARG